MARTFRWYNKKRGNRRTGSPTMGSIGEAIFFVVFLVVGSVALGAMILTIIIPEWRVNHEFIEHPCKVVAKRLAQTDNGEGALFRPEFQIEYTVNGVEYRTWTYTFNNQFSPDRESKQAILAQFAVGDTVPCWYDPLYPEQVVLWRGYNWWIYLLIFIPIVFVFIGAGGLVYTLLQWGKSAERRSAILQRVQEREILAAGGIAKKVYPCLPQRLDITNSPGTKLTYRLPIETSPGWALIGILLLCICWNGIVAVMVYYAVRGHSTGNPNWMVTIISIPFAFGGILLIIFFFWKLLVAAGIGPTLIEISQHPLLPGGEYKLFISQSGRLKVARLCLLLICQEEATYKQGTNTRTETREVYRQELYCREKFEIPPGLPFETECSLTVPSGVMHSFKSTHNRIDWKLVVEGSMDGWPEFRRAFSVVIYPESARVVA